MKKDIMTKVVAIATDKNIDREEKRVRLIELFEAEIHGNEDVQECGKRLDAYVNELQEMEEELAALQQEVIERNEAFSVIDAAWTGANI